MLNSVWVFVLLILAGYGVICLTMYFGQERLLFYPSQEEAGTPVDIGLAYEPVGIATTDGVTLVAWFLPGRTGRVLLFFHGNAGNMTHRLDSLEIFHDLGLSVLIIDYRGYGRSEGRVSEQGLFLDAEAAWRYLVAERGFAARNIVIFGRSLGAAIGARLAVDRKPGALIIESAFTSVPDMARDLYPLLPSRWLTRYYFNTAKYLQSVSCPVLVIHSPEDDIVPFLHGRRLFEQTTGSPKGFLEISGDHNYGFLASGTVYRDGLRMFLNTYRGTDE